MSKNQRKSAKSAENPEEIEPVKFMDDICIGDSKYRYDGHYMQIKIQSEGKYAHGWKIHQKFSTKKELNAAWKLVLAESAQSDPNLRQYVQSVDKKPAKPTLPDPSKQLATQLTDQYKRAISGTRDILLFGAMMMQLGGMLSRKGGEWQSGPGVKGTGLKGWIEEHCPEINYKTARSFYNLARGLAETFALPAKVDLSRLLTAPVEDLSETDASYRTQLDDFLIGKSKRQLEFDFGIRAPVQKLGGNVRLVKWINENHPELKGLKLVNELPKDVQLEFEEYLESQKPTPEESWNMRVDNARMYWTKVRKDLHIYTRADNPFHFAPLPKPEKEALLGALEKVCEEIRSCLK